MKMVNMDATTRLNFVGPPSFDLFNVEIIQQHKAYYTLTYKSSSSTGTPH